MKTKKMGVLFSGGIDSAALIINFLKHDHEVFPVYLACNFQWEKTELSWAQQFLNSIHSPKLKPLKIINIPMENAYLKTWAKSGLTLSETTDDNSVFIPARNIVLLIHALLYLSEKGVWNLGIGTLLGNPFPDGTQIFFRSLERLLSASFRNRVKIHIPFRKVQKKTLLKRSRLTDWHLTFSCIDPQNRQHCGKCNKCLERKKSFFLAKIPDKTPYKFPCIFPKIEKHL